MKRWIALLSLSLCYFTSAVCRGGNHTVDAAGGGDFVNVQAAIDAAEPGDIVSVSPGEYVIDEPIVFRGKAITVRGEFGASRTTLRMAEPLGVGRGSVVLFQSDEGEDSVLEGFTLTGGRGTGGRGGGIYCVRAACPTVVGCIITGNTSGEGRTFGGGVSCYGESFPTLVNCVITDNQSEFGGAVHCGDSGAARLINCILAGNNARLAGGAVNCEDDAHLTMIHCTVASNTANSFSGIRIRDRSSASIRNSIAWNGGVDSQTEGLLTVSHSCVEGGFDGQGNLAADPSFEGDGYHRLQPNSPCVDAGSPDERVDTDIEGAIRPCGRGVDVGAYERGSCRSFRRGDSNTDGVVTIADPVSTAATLFLGGVAFRCVQAADANADDDLDVSDAIHTLGYLFVGGVTLPPPGPNSCGLGDSSSALTCESYSACETTVSIPSLPGHPQMEDGPTEVDLEAFQLALEERFAYLEVNGVDYLGAIEAVRDRLPDNPGRTRMALEVQRVIALFVDGHARVNLSLREGYLRFLIEPSGERFVAFRADRSDFREAGHPYISAIDGVDLADWLGATRAIVPKGSPQYQVWQGLGYLRYLQFFRDEMGIQPTGSFEVELSNADGTSVRRVTLGVAGGLPTYGRWPRLSRTAQRLDGNIGYLRIPSMDQGAVDLIRAEMPALLDTDGLIVDVRGNGGGTRDALLELFPYFMITDDPPHVANAAVYRLFREFGENHLAPRFLFREDAPVWTAAERVAIAQFRETFKPEWTPPADKFSEWHYLAISKGPADGRPHYDKPVVILLDGKCFSATDIFLGALKGWRNVTLVGTPSGGGSARSQRVVLPHSGVEVFLASMASFQPSGKLYDTNGVHPDVVVEPVPEYFLIGGPDPFLDKALELLATP